ncbi:PilW family protein [Roseateles chitosanitabidus]|uniref:PilW family protein n=1 Tax=Roseateles chitosanitabidus TaxID=65048 RepID=UPI00082F8752|nr:PilW family protein [Roseateles chitosanitabidus]MBO9686989.1 PilW family protein [Roseateles chitosanitabidus]
MTTPRSLSLSGRQRGFTLIELLVSMTIGLVLIAALGVIINRFEVFKRRSAATSDLTLNTGYLAYDLDRQLRSAGSGLYQISGAFGCQIFASANGAAILPSPTAFPAPFAAVNTAVRATPLLVYPGAGANGSDVIQIMTASAGMSEAPIQVNANSATANTIQVINSLGVRGGDLMLLTEAAPRPNCMVVQAANGYVGGTSQVINLAGNYYSSSIGSLSILSFGVGSTTTFVSNLGNEQGNTPRFQLLGVNAAQQLVAYDLLRLNNMPNSATTPVPLADGVVDLRVRYGIDGLQNGSISNWVVPGSNGFTVAAMSGANSGAQTLIKQIIALRVAVLLRSDRIEKEVSNPGSYTLFQSLPAAAQVTVPTADTNRSYKVVEFTVPLRNAILTATNRPVIP